MVRLTFLVAFSFFLIFNNGETFIVFAAQNFFESHLSSYSKLTKIKRSDFKDELFSSIKYDNIATLKLKLTSLGKNRNPSVMDELWPVIGVLSGDIAATAIMEIFIMHDFSISEVFYSLLRRRFGEIAGINQVQTALNTYLDPKGKMEKNLSYGLLEKIAVDRAVVLFKEAYYQVSSLKDAKDIFRLIVMQNNENAFLTAISILEKHENDNRFSNDQEKCLLVYAMCMFSDSEIKPNLFLEDNSSDYWVQVAVINTLGNYSGQDVIDFLTNLQNHKIRTTTKKQFDGKLSRDELLLNFIEKSLNNSKRKTKLLHKKKVRSDRGSNEIKKDFRYSSNQNLTLDELAERYKPLIRISAAGSAGGSGIGVNLYEDGVYEYDDYIPMSVYDLNNNLNKMPKLVTSNGEDDLSDSTIDKLGEDDSSSSYLDFSPLWQGWDSLETGYKSLWNQSKPSPTVYYYTWNNLDKVYPYAVQYWFFYFYNDWMGDHAGDWETITIFFDRYKQPVELCYSTHYEARRHLYSLVDQEKNGHPHLYISNGGHGSYAKAGDTVYSGAADNHYGNKQVIGPADSDHSYLDFKEHYNLILINANKPEHWINFVGKWGDNDKAPQGPKYRTDATDDPVPWVSWFKGTYWDAANNKPKNPDNCVKRIGEKIFGTNENGPWDWGDGYPLEVPDGELSSVETCINRPELLEPEGTISTSSPIFKWNTRGIQDVSYYLTIFGDNINPINAVTSCENDICTENFGALFPPGKYFWASRAKGDTSSAWTDIKEFEIPLSGKVAIAFVLDESGSIDSPDFILEKEGFKQALNSLPVNGNIEIAVIFFSSSITISVELTTLNITNFSYIESGLNKSQNSGGTNMSAAINEAVSILNNTTAPTKIIFLATDGKPSNAGNTITAVENSRNSGVIVEPIGIGSGIDEDFLNTNVASKPPIANPRDFNEFATVITNKAIGGVSSAINLQFDPDLIDYGTFEASNIVSIDEKQSLNLLNDSDKSITITNISLGGQDYSDYKIISVNDFPVNSTSFSDFFTIRAHSFVSIVVSFLPTHSKTDYVATLTANGMNDTGNKDSIATNLTAKTETTSFSMYIFDASPTVSQITSTGMLLNQDNEELSEYDVALAIQQDINKNLLRSGIVTDGNARLLINTKTNIASGKIRFMIPQPAQTEAQLFSIDSNHLENGEVTIDVDISIDPDGIGRATAILKAGERFLGGQNVPEIEFSIQACIVDDNTGQCSNIKTNQIISERRAPVVLIHGLWSDAETWRDNNWGEDTGLEPSLNNSFFRVGVYEYDGNNGPSETMRPNEKRLADFIKHPKSVIGLCNAEAQDGFACTRNDIVAHSMGGLLARKYIHDNNFYRSQLNYNQGSVRRLITIGTPHFGSQLANLLRYDNAAVNNCIRDDDPAIPGIQNNDIEEAISWLAYDGNEIGSGIQDLAVGNSLLQTLNDNEQLIPTISLFGDAGTEFDLGGGLSYLVTKQIYEAGCNHDQVFGEHSDGVVPVCSGSAAGCLVNEMRIIPETNTQTLNNAFHVGMGTNENVISLVIQLLNDDLNNFSTKISANQ